MLKRGARLKYHMVRNRMLHKSEFCDDLSVSLSLSLSLSLSARYLPSKNGLDKINDKTGLEDLSYHTNSRQRTKITEPLGCWWGWGKAFISFTGQFLALN